MMLELLTLVPALPLAGFVVLALGGRAVRRFAAVIGVASVGLAAAVAVIVSAVFIASPPEGHAYREMLWQWMNVAGFAPTVSLYLDPLSLVMMLVVAIVSFMILLYSADFMSGEEGYARFFAYMDLFVGSMLILVLADNLLHLFLGWEGVGLCSYLLIGFWYKDSANGRAAMKAFIVTRIGDAAFLVGILLVFASLGTLDIQELSTRAASAWPVGSGLAVAAAALFLAGAVGKSAQLPLQTWLPDAMAGPTPVSALIHAATMVTAGVYLIARNHVLFELAPSVQTIVALVGVVTLLLAGASAATQRDIKRILAYSTISQIGYMLLALGVGAWAAGIFHFVTHAFFKSLLFLAAGVIIIALRREHDIFKMGGLRKELPLVFWVFLVASLSMTAIPPVFSGFFSKDWILAEVWRSPTGGVMLWTGGIVGVFLTSAYTFRLFFVVFFGELRTKPARRRALVVSLPLVVLAVGSALVGFLETPATFGGITAYSSFVRASLPPSAAPPLSSGVELALQTASLAASAAGLLFAYFVALGSPEYFRRLTVSGASAALYRYLAAGWGFDWLYDWVLVRPFVYLARVNKGDFFDRFYYGIAVISAVSHTVVRRSQTGQVRWYAAAVAIGAIVVLGIVVLL